jgi:hypothetical protein
MNPAVGNHPMFTINHQLHSKGELMKKLLVLSALLIIAAVPLFAHPGHAHATYMGTVSMLHGDNTFMIETEKGDVVTIVTNDKTAFTHADNSKAKIGDLAEGMRVVIKMSDDGKVATSIKMSPAKK